MLNQVIIVGLLNLKDFKENYKFWLSIDHFDCHLDPISTNFCHIQHICQTKHALSMQKQSLLSGIIIIIISLMRFPHLKISLDKIMKSGYTRLLGKTSIFFSYLAHFRYEKLLCWISTLLFVNNEKVLRDN